MSTDIQPPIRLPVWRLVKASLASVFLHLGNFVGRCWPWVAIIGVLVVGMHAAALAETLAPDVFMLPLVLAQTAGTAMVVVSWHRGLLLGEPGGPATAFRLDYPFWRYIGCAILILFIMGAPVLGVFMFAGIWTGPMSTSIIWMTLAMPIVAIVVHLIGARLMLALPMAATGAVPPLLRASWRLTQGNSWRLLGALIALYLITAIAAFVPLTLLVLTTDALGLHQLVQTLIISPAFGFGILLNTALFASFASYAFAVLTNHPLGRDVTG